MAHVLDSFRLDGRAALVTGGNRGLGAVFSRALSEAGAAVALCSRSEGESRKAAEEIAGSTGKQVIGFKTDVTNQADIDAMMDGIAHEFGRLDILVNNAGINFRHPAAGFPDDEWLKVLNTNLVGAFRCARAAGALMIKNGYGRIINVGSNLSLVGLPDRTAYASSKGGLLQMTRVLALEWAKYGITVNTLCPGPFETEINSAIIENPSARKFFDERLPIGRWGKPEELGGTIVYMASEASSFMTGATLVVDGGWTAQ